MPTPDPDPPTAAGDPLAGTKYRMLRQLGEGGMGEVYLVEHLVLGKEVVAKLLRPEYARDAGVVERMRVEAQALAALSHRNIVSVTDFGKTAAGRPFYVMERLDGQTVGQRLRRDGPPPLTESLDIAHQVLDALGVAHALGLIHRDIKPDNVFLHRDQQGQQVVKLLDFGIAKVSAGASGAPAPLAIPTADGAIIGTPRYISPEQILGRTVDHRADLYAVGLLLYSLLNGEGPFEHLRTASELFDAQLRLSPPSLVARNPHVSPGLDRAVLRALEKRPEDRYRDASEFASALAAAGHAASVASAARPIHRPAPPVPGRSVGSMDTLMSPAPSPAQQSPEPAPTCGRQPVAASVPDETLRDVALKYATSSPAPHQPKQTVRDMPVRHAGASQRGQRDDTERLQGVVPPTPEQSSTGSARPAQLASGQPRAGATTRESTSATRPHVRAAVAYATGAAIAALAMCVGVFGVDLRPPALVLIAAIASAAVGTGSAVVVAHRLR